MELLNDHIVPDHVFLRGIYKLHLETPDNVRDSHVHFHVGQTSENEISTYLHGLKTMESQSHA